jgi:hypothetical protein
VLGAPLALARQGRINEENSNRHPQCCVIIHSCTPWTQPWLAKCENAGENEIEQLRLYGQEHRTIATTSREATKG